MKKLILILLAASLAACNGPKDIKLSEMNEPANAKKLLETLTPQELQQVRTYVVNHAMRNNLDYKLTIKQALDAQKKEDEQDEKMRKMRQKAANSIK